MQNARLDESQEGKVFSFWPRGSDGLLDVSANLSLRCPVRVPHALSQLSMARGGGGVRQARPGTDALHVELVNMPTSALTPLSWRDRACA